MDVKFVKTEKDEKRKKSKDEIAEQSRKSREESKKEDAEERKMVESENRELATQIMNKINGLMEERKWKKADLVRETAISSNTIDSYFRSNDEYTKKKISLPKIQMLKTLAKTFQVPVDYLCGMYDMEDYNPNADMLYLLQIVKRLNMRIEDTGEQVVFTFKDKTMQNRFLSIKKSERTEFLKLNIDFHGKIISDPEFWNFKKEFYLYGHHIDSDELWDIDDYLDALKEAKIYSYKIEEYDSGDTAIFKSENEVEYLLESKIDEWANTEGYPTRFLNEVYIDLFYNADRYKKYGKL